MNVGQDVLHQFYIIQTWSETRKNVNQIDFAMRISYRFACKTCISLVDTR